MKTQACSILFGSILWSICATSGAAQTLVHCSEGGPQGFDPALHTTLTTFDASSRPIYDRLTETKIGTTEVVPGLAESWDIDWGAPSVTFHLREGVNFHSNAVFNPTRDLTADDVIFTFDRQMNPDNPFYDVFGGTWTIFDGMGMSDVIEDIEKIDDFTVKFNLAYPSPQFLANLAMDFGSVVSKEYADAMLAANSPEMLDQAPIGTGPFAFETYEEGVLIRYQRSPDYWGPPALVETLIFAITPQTSERYAKLQDGTCHVMAYPNRSNIAAMRANDDLVVMSQEGLNVSYLAYNTQMPPYDNAKVRRALNMAINKQVLLEQVFQGHGLTAKNPIPPTIWAYDETTVDDVYDPQAARAILNAEGYTELDLKIWAMPVKRTFSPNSTLMAEMIQDDLRQIGVNVEIVSYEWEEYLLRSRDIGRNGAVLLGWTGDNGDPDNFLRILLSCRMVEKQNRAQWCNEEFDTLLRKAALSTSQEERATLYAEAQAIFKQEAPWATLAHSLRHTLVRSEVQNFVMHPLGHHIFNQVSLQGRNTLALNNTSD